MVNKLYILMVCWPNPDSHLGSAAVLESVASDLYLHSCWDGDLTLSSATQALEAALMWRKLFFALTELNVPACSLHGGLGSRWVRDHAW